MKFSRRLKAFFKKSVPLDHAAIRDSNAQVDRVINSFVRLASGGSNIGKEIQRLIKEGLIKKKAEVIMQLFYTTSQEDLLCSGQEMRFLFGVSGMHYTPLADKPENAVQLFDGCEDFYFLLHKSPHKACLRCWFHCSTVDDHIDHLTGEIDYPQICFRCVNNIFGLGENRRYI